MSYSVVNKWGPRCFLSPQMEKIIGGEESRKISQNLRRMRQEHKIHRAAMAVQHPVTNKTPQFHVYTDGQKETLPGTELKGSKIAKDKDAQNALAGAQLTVDFYKTVYNRNSIDGHGMDVISTVHYGKKYPNAFWNGQQMVYGDGDGNGDSDFVTFTRDTDVIGHEITHGVTEHTASLDYENQSGALNESVSDIFGSQIKQYGKKQTVKQADWLIGDFVLNDKPDGTKEALRTMTEKCAYDLPRLGKDTQPKRMGDYHNLPNDDDHDNGGVHDNSGIPNHFFYLLSMDLGEKADVVHSWEQPGHIVYDALTSGSVKHNASFVDFANATVASAVKLFKANSNEYNATLKAWKQVEVL